MSRRAFSLIEMLVVIGILMVLLSILLPAVGKARDQANSAVCQSHVRVLTQACILFASDHDGHLPGSLFNRWDNWNNNSDFSAPHQDWLFGVYSAMAFDGTPGNGTYDATQLRYFTGPQYGTLWPYVNNTAYQASNSPGAGSYQTYLCPSLSPGVLSGGKGSNGRFDYAIFSEFDGAALKDVPATCRLYTPSIPADPLATNSIPYYPPETQSNLPISLQGVLNWGFPLNYSIMHQDIPTPLVCQEDAANHIAYNLEGQHAQTDQLTHIHFGGSYYGSVDGAVYFVNEPDLDPTDYYAEGSFLWTCRTPSGSTRRLCDDPGQWNWWASQ